MLVTLRRAWRAFTLFLSIAVIGAVLAACGTSSSRSASSISAGVSGHTINWGIGSITTGPAVAYNEVLQGVIAHLDKVDATGGINGYKFHFTSINTNYTASGTILALKELAHDNLLGASVLISPAPTQCMQIAEQHHFALEAIAGERVVTSSTSPYVYSVVPDYEDEAAMEIRAMAQRGYKVIGFPYFTNTAGTAGLAGAQAEAAKLGVKVVGDGIAVTATDMTPVAVALHSANVDAVVAWLLGPQVAGLQKVAPSVGLTLPNRAWWAFFGTFGGYLSEIGSAANGTTLDSFVVPPRPVTPIYSQYLAQMQKEFPKSISPLSEEGWADAAGIQAAVQTVTAGGKRLTEARFVAAMQHLNLNTAQAGTAYSIHTTPTQHDWYSYLYVYTVKNSQYVSANKVLKAPRV